MIRLKDMYATKNIIFCNLVFLLTRCCYGLISRVALCSNERISNSSAKSSTTLHAVLKSQIAVYDGSELASIISFLQNEGTINNSTLAARAPRKGERVGAIKFVSGTIDDGPSAGKRIVGVEIPKDEMLSKENNTLKNSSVQVDDQTFLYSDSVSFIPSGMSDADAISTAAVSVCGVHCGKPTNNISGKVNKTKR